MTEPANLRTAQALPLEHPPEPLPEAEPAPLGAYFWVGAGRYLGLGGWWSRLPLLRRHPILQ